MPPKRKAATKDIEEPPTTRRRTTRSTATADSQPPPRARRGHPPASAKEPVPATKAAANGRGRKAIRLPSEDVSEDERSVASSPRPLPSPGPSRHHARTTRSGPVAKNKVSARTRKPKTRNRRSPSPASSDEDELAGPPAPESDGMPAPSRRGTRKAAAVNGTAHTRTASADSTAMANGVLADDEGLDPIDMLSSSPAKRPAVKTYVKRNARHRLAARGDGERGEEEAAEEPAPQPARGPSRPRSIRREVYVQLPELPRQTQPAKHSKASDSRHQDLLPEDAPLPRKRGRPPKPKAQSPSPARDTQPPVRGGRPRANKPPPSRSLSPETLPLPLNGALPHDASPPRRGRRPKAPDLTAPAPPLAPAGSPPASPKKRKRPIKLRARPEPEPSPSLETQPEQMNPPLLQHSESADLELLPPPLGSDSDSDALPAPAEPATSLPFPPLPTPATPHKPSRSAHASPTRPSIALPEHLHACLQEQQRVVLTALRSTYNTGQDGDDDESPNAATRRDLEDLLKATIQRGEGNSCLVMGPRSSGKTSIVEDVLSSLPRKPIIVRLSGHVQRTDRSALREIARQVAKQTEQAFGAELEDDAEEDPNPLDDEAAAPGPPPLPPSHLPTLISSLPTLGRPTILVLDAFDLFAEHGRQALLYCLLDTAQSCRAGTDTKGIAVVGVTSRIDTLNILEKRVKSRFSGRMLRTAGPRAVAHWKHSIREALLMPLPHPIEMTGAEEWSELWTSAIEHFLADRVVDEKLCETFELVKDTRLLCRLLTEVISKLSLKDPYPTASSLLTGAADQRDLEPFPFISSLPYPSTCLLIAAMHERTAGNDTFTFEMLHDAFQIQVRTSASAPVQNRYGGSIGMVGCGRDVLLAAFERLIDTRVFVPAAGTSTGSARQFVRHRCLVEYDQVKRTVEASKRTDLKKWLKKAS